MRGRILLVEDEPNIIEALRFILEKQDYEVRVVSSGAKALDVIADRVPDLIILDIMLPDKDGLTLLKEIRGHSPISNIPIMMLTAKGANKDRQTATDAGATLFMTKPFSNREVVDAVEELIINANRK